MDSNNLSAKFESFVFDLHIKYSIDIEDLKNKLGNTNYYAIIEECSELATEISVGTRESIIEEMADVLIVIDRIENEYRPMDMYYLMSVYASDKFKYFTLNLCIKEATKVLRGINKEERLKEAIYQVRHVIASLIQEKNITKEEILEAITNKVNRIERQYKSGHIK